MMVMVIIVMMVMMIIVMMVMMIIVMMVMMIIVMMVMMIVIVDQKPGFNLLKTMLLIQYSQICPHIEQGQAIGSPVLTIKVI